MQYPRKRITYIQLITMPLWLSAKDSHALSQRIFTSFRLKHTHTHTPTHTPHTHTHTTHTQKQPWTQSAVGISSGDWHDLCIYLLLWTGRPITRSMAKSRISWRNVSYKQILIAKKQILAEKRGIVSFQSIITFSAGFNQGSVRERGGGGGMSRKLFL